MYLKAVEINGFKSFGDKVYIDFNRGITSIVGPNGSGKSNILDAVLWVLGEQSYKNIRAKESQDVIFSGGKEKKPATKAEVSLIIDNADRYLDLDNDTVKITRRIHISGENEYLINDTKSRLKEIGTLFLDTGIGKTAYSVIGQGKVERIINEPTAAALCYGLDKKKEEKGLSPKEAQNNLLVWVQSLMGQGYTIHDIKSMRLSDFDLMVQALEIKESKEEEETTLDKAFPFLFG